MKYSRVLKISRPRFWIYEVGPYVIGVAAAASHSHSFGWFAFPVAIFFLFFTYPANLYIYGINDMYDYETDKLNPKKISYESLVLPKERKSLFLHILVVCVPFILYSFFVTSVGALVALGAFFFFAGFYSAKPIRAKARPFLDSIFSAGHYVATGLFSYLLTAHIIGATVSVRGMCISIIAGMCWAVSMHAYSAVPDIKADGDAGLMTIAIALGKKNTLIACAMLYALSSIVAFGYVGVTGIAMAIIYVLLMLFSINTNDEQLLSLYKYFPAINTIAGMFVFFLLVVK